MERMIEPVTLDSVKGWAAYLKDGVPSAREAADAVKVILDNGSVQWFFKGDGGSKADDAMWQSPRFPTVDAGFEESKHPRDKKGEFSAGGGVTAQPIGEHNIHQIADHLRQVLEKATGEKVKRDNSLHPRIEISAGDTFASLGAHIELPNERWAPQGKVV